MTDTQEICTAILGTNGTGKSTLVAKMIAAFVKKGGRALIVTPDDREWGRIKMIDPANTAELRTFKGVRKTIFLKGQTLETLTEHYTNGMIIFDDCRAYLTASVDLPLHYLLIRRRQAHTNMIFVAHGFTDLIPKIFTFATHIVLFRTLDNISKRKGTIRDYPKMEQAVIRVNRIAERNPHYFEIIPQ